GLQSQVASRKVHNRPQTYISESAGGDALEAVTNPIFGLKEETMSYASRLRENYSLTYEIEPEVLAATIEALNDCAQACTSDAGDDLNDPSVNEMVRCI